MSPVPFEHGAAAPRVAARATERGHWRSSTARRLTLAAGLLLAAVPIGVASASPSAARISARFAARSTARSPVAPRRLGIGAGAPAGAAWTSYGGNEWNQRYSALRQITTANVAQLKGAWSFRTGVFSKKTSFESSPLVVGDTMYLTGPHSEVFALNATTGKKLWEYTPSYARKLSSLPLCCGEVNRGVAYGDGRVYVAQLDGKLVALDAKTGAVDWAVQVGSPHAGFSETAAPLFAGGRLYLGVSGAEYPMRGFMSAFNPANGAVIWRFYTIPGPGQIGHNTWPATNAWKTGGGSVWDTPAIDPSLGLLYFSVGNPNPDLDGHVRPGNNLFTNSIVALSAGSGKLAWYYQEVHHDTWDYDAASPPLLFDATVGGRAVTGLAEAGKDGWVFLLNRRNGAPLHPIPEVHVPTNAWQASAPTQPEPVGTAFVPHRCVAPGFPAGGAFDPLVPNQPTLLCPSADGGSEWSPTSFNPATGDVYVCGIDKTNLWVAHNASSPPPDAERLGSTWTDTVTGHYGGTITAINVAKGTVAWQRRLALPCIGGSATTAGGLVFIGQSNGRFDALDAATGRTLWSFQTGAGANAPPVVYEESGTEYVAVAAGGSKQEDSPRGDELWVFSLHGTLGPAPAPTVSTPAVYARSIKITADGLSPAKVIVGLCATITWRNDTSETERLLVGGTVIAPALRPGASVARHFVHSGAYAVKAESAAASSTGAVLATSALPRGGACAPR